MTGASSMTVGAQLSLSNEHAPMKLDQRTALITGQTLVIDGGAYFH